jgi:hypothetical protein
VFKGVDYSTSLLSGPYVETGIGRVFKNAFDATSSDSFVIDDFAPYEPSNNVPA